MSENNLDNLPSPDDVWADPDPPSEDRVEDGEIVSSLTSELDVEFVDNRDELEVELRLLLRNVQVLESRNLSLMRVPVLMKLDSLLDSSLVELALLYMETKYNF